MKLVRLVLRPESPWGSPLRSDTLSGLLLCRLAERDGAEACGRAIDAFREGQPPFVLSSPLPPDALPMPALPPMPRGEAAAWLEDAALRPVFGGKEPSLFLLLQKLKKFRKKTHIPLALWRKTADALSARRLFPEMCGEAEEKPDAQTGFEPHVSVDRATGGALQGGLFFTRMTYFQPGAAAFHVYALTDDAADLVDLVRRAGEQGFGRDATTGKGRFSVLLDESFDPAGLELFDPARRQPGEAGLLLSVFAAPNLAGLKGWYKLESKAGKAGPGARVPFKRPFVLAREGSLLESLPSGSGLLEGLSPDPALVQVVAPLMLKCRLAGRE